MDPRQYQPPTGQPQPGYQPPQAPQTYQPQQAGWPNAYGSPQQTQPPLQQNPGFDPYGFMHEQSPTPPKQRSKLPVFIVGTALVALLVLSVVFLAGGNNSDTDTNKQNIQKTDDASKDVVPRSDGKLDLSSQIASSGSLKAQAIQADIKEQINLSSGFSFMVNKIEPYQSINSATRPADAKKFVVVTVVVGNRLKDKGIGVSYLDFQLRSDSDQTYNGSIVTNEILDNAISSPSELKPGQQITGKIVFEVGATDSNFVFRHSETYQKTTDNTTFDVAGEIVVELPAPPSQAGEDEANPDAGSPVPEVTEG